VPRPAQQFEPGGRVDGAREGVVAADLDAVDASVAIEAWRLTGEIAADFASPALLDRAESRAARLARKAGDYAGPLRAAAARRLSLQ